MKILITETFQHFMPVGAGWIEGLQQLGHTVYGLQSDVYSILDVDEELDIVVFVGMHTVNKDHITRFKDKWPDTKLVVLCYGFEEHYLELKPYVSLWVEHNYKHDLVDALFDQQGMKLIHVPLATSSNLFYKIDGVDKPYDTSFVGQFGGSGHGYREEDHYLYPIMKLPINGFWSGFNNYPRVPANNLVQIYNATKINLNFHYPSQKTQSQNQADSIDFNSRVFDIALTGNFQLCDHPYVKELFQDGVVYAAKEEWRDVFDYYLNNDEAREEKARVGFEICKSKHTWQCRMVDFINAINNIK